MAKGNTNKISFYFYYLIVILQYIQTKHNFLANFIMKQDFLKNELRNFTKTIQHEQTDNSKKVLVIFNKMQKGGIILYMPIQITKYMYQGFSSESICFVPLLQI